MNEKETDNPFWSIFNASIGYISESKEDLNLNLLGPWLLAFLNALNKPKNLTDSQISKNFEIYKAKLLDYYTCQCANNSYTLVLQLQTDNYTDENNLYYNDYQTSAKF